MGKRRKSPIADDDLVRARIAGIWCRLIQDGRILGAKSVENEYCALYKEDDYVPSINDRTAGKIVKELLRDGKIEVRYEKSGLVPEFDSELSFILDKLWGDSVKKFVVVDIPKSMRDAPVERYQALNSIAYPHLKAALTSYMLESGSQRSIGWGSGYTAFDLADRISRDPDMVKVLSDAEIYPLTGAIYKPHIHMSLLDAQRVAGQHLSEAMKVFDAHYNATIIQRAVNCEVKNVSTSIFNMDRKREKEEACQNWIQMAELALDRTKKKHGYDESEIQNALEARTSEFNVIGAGAFGRNHKIFDILKGYETQDETYEIPEALREGLNQLADITDEIKRLTKSEYDEELDVCYDICNRFYVVNLPEKFKKNPLLQMMVNDARAIVDGKIIPFLDTVRKTILRFSGKSNNMVTNGANRAYLIHDLLGRGIIRFNMICIDVELAQKLITLAKPFERRTKAELLN